MEQLSQNLQKAISNLNPAQKEATLNIAGPELIIAGAGSGKTRVLTTRMALLLEKGVMPERILALTFTKKAAEEMRKRIIEMSGPEAARLQMGTFHSVFIRFLRPWAHMLGFPASFTILDEDDAMSCLKRCIKAVLEKGRVPKDARTKQLDLEAFDAEESGWDDIEKSFSEKSAKLYFGDNERYYWEIHKASFPEPKNTPVIRKPELSEMHADIVAFVKKHQGEKGFILTDDPDKSTIYGYVYLQSENRIEEFEVKAVRVHEGEIQVIIDTETVRYSEDDVKESCRRAEGKPWYQLGVFGNWLPVGPDEDDIEYIPTIFRIAECIEEYV